MNPTDLLYYLNHSDDRGLYARADAVRRQSRGAARSVHAVIPISNVCDRACRHCDLRSANGRLKRYRLTPSQVLDMAAEAAANGAGTIVLRSGNDLGYSARLIGELVREIKSRHGLAVTLSLGQRGFDEYAYWKECGADRCQVNLETSEPFAFKRLDQGTDFSAKLHLLETLRDLGYEVGSGVVAGLPGTTPMDGLRDLLFLAELHPAMVEIEPFVPRPGTPMDGLGPGSVDTAMRMAALLRIMLPEACIPAMASLDELRPGSGRLALERGCDAVQPAMPVPFPAGETRMEGQHVR